MQVMHLMPLILKITHTLLLGIVRLFITQLMEMEEQ